MAFAASSASATDPIEVETLAGAPCTLATCLFHVDGESHLARLDNGLIVSTCADEFFVEFAHNGSGHIRWTGLPHGAPGCNTTNCTTMSPVWQITSREEIAAGQVEFSVNICLRSLATGAENECPVDVIATSNGGGDYHFDAATACVAAGTRVEMEADIEDFEGVLIHHL